jgi:ankyrin repeat protein
MNEDKNETLYIECSSFFTYSNAIYDLHKAVGRGNVGEVKRLIHNGEDIHCPEEEEGMTPLHVAAYLGRLEIVQILINAGAELNSRDSSGDTPLHAVCITGRDPWREGDK